MAKTTRRKGVTKAQIAEAFAYERKTIKPKRKRKPMTAEQKAAAAERLKKAREARAEKAGPKKLRYHPACYDKKGTFALENVLEWLKEAKAQASQFKATMRNRGISNKDLAHANDRYHWWYGYVNDINWYLRHGDWISNYYGKGQQNKTKWEIVAASSYKPREGNE